MAAPKLKTALSAVAGATLALTPLTAANSQRVQDVSVTNIEQINLPMRDARGIQIRGVQMAAAMDSEGGQIMVFFGDDPRAFEAAKQGARMAIADGVPLRGMMVADPVTPETAGESQISGSDQVTFYADGILTGTIDNADRNPERLALMVRSELKRGQGVLENGRQLAANTATLN